MKRFLLSILLTFWLAAAGFSQEEFNNWYFGLHKAITFNSGVPVLLTPIPAILDNVPVCVSDSAGNLLFYSDGMTVYNRNHAIMPHGTGLHGSSGGYYQTVTSVKKIGDDSTYILFITSKWNPNPSLCLPSAYTVINMRLDGTLGDVDTNFKNVPLQYGRKGYGSITGTRHQNNRDAWVVVRLTDPDSNYFASYRVTMAGIETVPILSNSSVHCPQMGTTTGPVPQQIKISQGGTRLVCLYFQDTLEVCDFNPSTGEVSPKFKFHPKYNGEEAHAQQVEFSVDGHFLYYPGSVTSLGGFHAFQYDATAPDSAQFVQSMIDAGSIGYKDCGLQMGPDWKIYGTYDNLEFLWIIHNPTLPGIGCGLQTYAFNLGNPSHADGLPQFVQRYKAYIHHDGNCNGEPVTFSGDIWPPAVSYHWDFGDPGSGGGNYSNLSNPSHTYTTSGDYIVRLSVTHNDLRNDSSQMTIHIEEGPQVVMDSLRTICTGDSTTFDAGMCVGCSFIWKYLVSGLQVGNTQTLKAWQDGKYTVAVTNPSGCTTTDTIQLVTTLPPVVTNNPLSKSICSGELTNIPLFSNVNDVVFHWSASLTLGSINGFSADSGLVIN